MPKKRVLDPKSIWDVDEVTEAFRAAGVREMHVQKLYSRLAKDPYVDLDELHGLPDRAKEILSTQFVRMTSTCKSVKRSADGETTKLLIELQDGQSIEAVVMMYDTSKNERNGLEGGRDGGRGRANKANKANGEADETASEASTSTVSSMSTVSNNKEQNKKLTGGKRYTLCVSSEVGCQMGCTFCATGTMGLQADLTAGEIIEQLVHARLRATAPRNIVFMGMGEPMDNYKHVVSAITMMTDGAVFALKRQHVTLSTVGVIPRIKQMADDLPGVSLALSLHAPTQDLRAKIVPSARAYKLDKLMAAVDEYQEKTKQKVFIEYVMLGPDFNCTNDHAHKLGRLLRGRDVVVNVIPWNPILSPSFDFMAPPDGDVDAFLKILYSEYGLHATCRQEKGQDVGAACGQLVISSGRGGGGCGKEREIEDLA